MPEYLSKNTVRASFWCKKCIRDTMHIVANGHKGSCVICLNKLAPMVTYVDDRQMSFADVLLSPKSVMGAEMIDPDQRNRK